MGLVKTRRLAAMRKHPVARRAQIQKKGSKMKRLLIGACVLAVLLVVVFVIFVAGFELGHRRGYDKGWRDCTFDAKEMVHPVNDDMFWKWYDSANSVTRKRRSFFE